MHCVKSIHTNSLEEMGNRGVRSPESPWRCQALEPGQSLLLNYAGQIRSSILCGLWRRLFREIWHHEVWPVLVENGKAHANSFQTLKRNEGCDLGPFRSTVHSSPCLGSAIRIDARCVWWCMLAIPAQRSLRQKDWCKCWGHPGTLGNSRLAWAI